jgi:hypothetical protein
MYIGNFLLEICAAYSGENREFRVGLKEQKFP